MATDLITAGEMIRMAAEAGIQLGVVSQHCFDDSIIFLKKASGLTARPDRQIAQANPQSRPRGCAVG
jgi:hypothetical protein